MKERLDLIVKSKFIDKYRSGYPLIFKEAIFNLYKLEEEGTILDLVDEDGGFLARAYYGKQNKGYGWVLTQKENEEIDLNFFMKRFIVEIGRAHV